MKRIVLSLLVAVLLAAPAVAQEPAAAAKSAPAAEKKAPAAKSAPAAEKKAPAAAKQKTAPAKSAASAPRAKSSAAASAKKTEVAPAKPQTAKSAQASAPAADVSAPAETQAAATVPRPDSLSAAEAGQTPEMTVVRQPILSGVYPAGFYLLEGKKIVPKDESLVLEAGARFLMLGAEAGIDVHGSLVAEGTGEEPVRFSSAVDRSIPGAWRGLSFSPGARADLRHVEIAHAARAVALDGAEAWLDHVRISESSEAGIFAVEASVYMTDCEIGEDSPQAAGVLATHGSRVGVERGSVAGAKIGIAASGYAAVDLVDAAVRENETGLLLVDSVALGLSGARVFDNRIGAMTTFEARKRPTGVPAALGLYGDERLFGLPPEVAGNRRDWSRKSDAEGRAEFDSLTRGAADDRLLIRPEGYAGGIRSEGLTMPGVEHFGSLTVGLQYHDVETERNRTDDTLVIEGDTVAPGDLYPNRFHVARFRPYASYYSQTRFGSERMLEVQADVAWDEWSDWSANPVSLVWESPKHHLKLGHFTADGNPLMLSGMPVLGGAYAFNTAMDALRQKPLFGASVILGEVKRPLSEGDRNPDLFGDVVEPGEAVAQELFLMTRISFSPLGGGELAVGYTRDWDRRNDPVLRDGISAESVLEDAPVDGQGLFGEFSWKSSGGELEFRATMGYGFADSTQRAWNLAVEQWLDRNNILVEADTIRSLLLRKQGVNTTQLERALPPRLGMTGRQALDEIRRLSADLKDSIVDGYVSGFDLSPERLAAEFGADWRHAKSAVSLGWRFLGRDFASPGAPDLVSNRREYYLKMSQGVSNWWTVGFDGRLSVEDASADKYQPNVFGFGEGSILGFDTDWSNLAELSENRIRPKTSLDIRLDNGWKIPGGFGFDLGYGYGLRHRRTMQTLMKDTTAGIGVFDDPFFSSAARRSAFGALPDTLAQGFAQKLTTHSLSARLSWTNRALALSAGTEFRWDIDRSDFDRWAVEKSDWALRDTTWGKMGWEFGRNDAFVFSVPLEFRWRGSFLSNRLAARLTSRDYAELDRSEGEWSLTETLEWRAIPAKLSLIPETGVSRRSVDRRATEDGITRLKKDAEEYSDFYASLTSRYAITPRWSMQIVGRWDSIERSNSPEDDVTDLSADFSTTWEF